MTIDLHRRSSRLVTVGAVAAAAAIALSGCSAAAAPATTGGDGTGTITVWAHQGEDSENSALQAAVAAYNAANTKTKVKLTLLASDTYTTTVSSTPASKLPDVLEMDGPTLSNYVFNEKLAPLAQYVSPATLANATAGSLAEGTVAKKVYGLAMFDSALGIYGNKKLLDAAGVKYPTGLADAWTAEQFTADLGTLAAAQGGKALDIHEEYGLGGEWGSFAFSPILWSAGGGLITDNKSTGVMDSAASVKALNTLASWKPFIDSNADGKAFTGGRVALGWGGHWNYPDYSKALGADLVVMPLPNFGLGSKTGQGSWTWGIGAETKNGKAAGSFLDSLLNDKNVSAMTTANGAPPATKSALAMNATYSATGPLALFAEQLNKTCGNGPITASCVAVPRPVTAGYPVITSKFSSALSAIFGGADAAKSLGAAAKSIDQNYSDNSNYK